MGFSYSRIIKVLEEEYGDTVSIPTISFWTRNCHNPYGEGLGEPDEDQRLLRIVNPCAVLAYVIGASARRWIYELERHRHDYMIVLIVKDCDFAAVSHGIDLKFGRSKYDTLIYINRPSYYAIKTHW